MSVTVRDLLRLPALSEGQVITGENGLDRTVSTVSVLESGGDTDQYFATGELVITSLFTVNKTAEEQCRIVQSLWGNGCSALVIFCKDEVPGGIDRHAAYAASMVGLPLIFLSVKDDLCGFGGLTYDIMGLIYSDGERPERTPHNNLINEFTELIYPSDKTPVITHKYMAERCLGTLFDPAEMEKVERYMTLLRKKVKKDALATLSTYLLEGNSQVKLTSELLGVHRNTILYRLNSVGDALGMDVDSMPLSYDLALVCALERLSRLIDRKETNYDY